MLLLCMHLIFSDEKPQKRVAVIVEKSGDEKWDSFINGLKQAAEIRNIHLIICNTDEIEDAQEEKSLICEQLDNQVDAFIVQAAPGKDTGGCFEKSGHRSRCCWLLMMYLRNRRTGTVRSIRSFRS